MQGRNSVLRDFQRFMLKSLTQEINVMENKRSGPLRRPALITLAECLSLALQPPPRCQIGRISSIPTFCFWVKNDF